MICILCHWLNDNEGALFWGVLLPFRKKIKKYSVYYDIFQLLPFPFIYVSVHESCRLVLEFYRSYEQMHCLQMQKAITLCLGY